MIWIASFDILEDPIFLHDEKFHILRCNKAYKQKAGIPYDQIIGHPYFDVFPKTHAPMHKCLSEIENKAIEGTEDTIKKDDIVYHSRAYIVKDEKQNYLYSVHILEDISQRIAIQKALQTSESRYRRLFEAAKDGILILDAETGVIVDANAFIINLSGYTLNEMIGKNLWKIGLIADIAESKISFEELQKNEYVRYEDLPIKTKDGQLVDVEFISNVYLVDSQKVIQCNIRDISERVQSKKLLSESEGKFRSITATAQDAIIIINDEGNIGFWNEAAEDIFGYTKKEAEGKSLHPLMVPKRFHEVYLMVVINYNH